jgi:acyl carrier protein
MTHKKWDSIGNFNLLLSIEKKFSIRFSSQEFNKLKSFKEIKESCWKKN